MESALAKQPAPSAVAATSDAPPRISTGGAATPWLAEWIALAFFSYLALLGFVRDNPFSHRAAFVSVPLAIWGGIWLESQSSRPWTRVLRQWLSLGLILAGYWSIEWFSTPAKIGWLQDLWLGWDRVLLFQFGLQRAIECLGPVIPFLLEAAYLSLYAIPPAALISLYVFSNPRGRRQFVATLFLGTFLTYAMLPWIAVESPRRVYPGQDEPRQVTAPRTVNTYVLDHMDISTGVFPSGHCAVAFSTAFGLLFVIPQRRPVWGGAFAVAVMVFLATIYGRYHYAVDGLASIVIAAIAAKLTAKWSASYAD